MPRAAAASSSYASTLYASVRYNGLMQPQRKTAFISVNLTQAARDELRRATLDLTTPAERRLSMSDVLLAALRVSAAHADELLGQLKTERP